jgi:polysaccharide export outer membrane protein
MVIASRPSSRTAVGLGTTPVWNLTQPSEATKRPQIAAAQLATRTRRVEAIPVSGIEVPAKVELAAGVAPAVATDQGLLVPPAPAAPRQPETLSGPSVGRISVSAAAGPQIIPQVNPTVAAVPAAEPLPLPVSIPAEQTTLMEAAPTSVMAASQPALATEVIVPPAPPVSAVAPSPVMSCPPMPCPPMACPVNPICPRLGVQCPGCPQCGCTSATWYDEDWIPWEAFAQGEYIGPPRLPHVPEYRLRVDDTIQFVYRLTRKQSDSPYRIEVADELEINVYTIDAMTGDYAELPQEHLVLVQPDGAITVGGLGQVPAAGRTIEELRQHLMSRADELSKGAMITVTPTKLNTLLTELINTVDARFGAGGQSQQARVTPEGTVRLPAIGTVAAQGLTLEELQHEVEARYAEIVAGLEVTPILLDRAPRYIYVTGEVKSPGRFELTGPTTVSQAIALAGSWNFGAYLQHVVIYRRDDDWQLMATRVNLKSLLLYPEPCPEGEIWLRDADVIVVPKSPILFIDDMIDLIFTRGVYSVFPVIYAVNFSKLSTI